jgi:hypothetical protein
MSTRFVSLSADSPDPPGLNDYDSFAEGYTASNETSFVHAYYENLWHREAGLEPDYFATYNYTVEWTAGGQSAVLRFWTRPLQQASRRPRQPPPTGHRRGPPRPRHRRDRRRPHRQGHGTAQPPLQDLAGQRRLGQSVTRHQGA